MVPMTVVAEMAHGIAHASPWMPSLDGILAAELSDRLNDEAIATGNDRKPRLNPTTQPPDLDLPLARCALGQDWHWMATCATPVGSANARVRWWTGRVDHRALGEMTSTLPANVSDRQGPYRARKMPLLVTATSAIVWRAVGDPAQIDDVVQSVAAIGKKRAQGEGRVLSWTVSVDLTLDQWSAGHLYPDGRLGRICPPECLEGRHVVTGGVGLGGVRPPAMHPDRQRSTHLPAPAVPVDSSGSAAHT